MLVLTRNVGESIRVGADIELKILSTGKRVKVGIEAPETIEVVRGELCQARSAEALPKDESQLQSRASKFAVLLVEDDPVHAKVISRILSKEAGADVSVAETGEKAVQRLWNDGGFDTSPNLILLDLRLPGMNGLDVLVRIKSDRQLRRTPVVVLSSSSEQIEIRRCLDAGANAYVTKSPNHDEFRTSLNRIAGFWGAAHRPDDAGLN